jgi:hypothetical protein
MTRVGIALAPDTAEALRRVAADQGITLSSLLRRALAAPLADARPLPSGPEVVTLRLTEEQAARLRSAAATRGESLSLFVRIQLAALLRGGHRNRQQADAPRRSFRRPAAAPLPATSRRRVRRDRVALQVCGHTVSASEVEAAADGLVWCPRCERSRYPERSL